jgi:hypothetical protein
MSALQGAASEGDSRRNHNRGKRTSLSPWSSKRSVKESVGLVEASRSEPCPGFLSVFSLDWAGLSPRDRPFRLWPLADQRKATIFLDARNLHHAACIFEPQTQAPFARARSWGLRRDGVPVPLPRHLVVDPKGRLHPPAWGAAHFSLDDRPPLLIPYCRSARSGCQALIHARPLPMEMLHKYLRARKR